MQPLTSLALITLNHCLLSLQSASLIEGQEELTISRLQLRAKLYVHVTGHAAPDQVCEVYEDVEDEDAQEISALTFRPQLTRTYLVFIAPSKDVAGRPGDYIADVDDYQTPDQALVRLEHVELVLPLDQAPDDGEAPNDNHCAK